MPKYLVDFEASATILIEIEVDAEDEAAAMSDAQKLWDAKEVTGRLSSFVDLGDNARKGLAKVIGLGIPYASISPDENGFEIVHVFTADDGQESAA